MQIGGKGPVGDPQDKAVGWPRDFLGNRFIYAVISQRAHGLSIGVNLNPEKYCNFDCIYCEVQRGKAREERPVDVNLLTKELTHMLDLAVGGGLRAWPRFRKIPEDLLQLKEVALSGDGEPTLCPNFDQAVAAVLRVRSQRPRFFKIVLLSNTAGLFRPHVQRGWRELALEDEVWLKLEAGTEEHMKQINRPEHTTLKNVMANILQIGRERPVVIQSLFPMLAGEEPDSEEIEGYVHRLQELVAGGAQISLVQIYSAHRPAQNPSCRHLPLSSLSAIARRVREKTGLRAEVF
ncbi:MAG: radical SAM protein [Verrucomicrobiota bacterium]|jgi:wyosine [tRNA(Phe)-imidazoG37] synthetase (radical SAM superfamily)